MKYNVFLLFCVLSLLLTVGAVPCQAQPRGGAPVDYIGFPKDLSTSALAIRQVTSKEYYSYTGINKALKKRFKKYPFTYSLIAPAQYPTVKELVEAGYHYEFLFRKVKLTKHRQTSGGIVDTNMQEKDLFWVMVRDLKTGRTWSPQRTLDQYPFAFKDFVKAVNKSFK